jgi:hypothetical protein
MPSYLAAMPEITVEIAFNPTNILARSQTWTDVSKYWRDGSTHGGRQHYLDRVESSTLNMTFDNRDGYFYNGATNGTSATLRVPLPIRVFANYGATFANVFTGVIDNVEPKASDALNTDVVIHAVDILKYLSLTYLSNPNFYTAYADVSSTRSWYATPAGHSLPDKVGTFNSSIWGEYQRTEGVLLYDVHQAIDLTNGTQNANTADILIPVATSGSTALDNGIDFWVIGQELSGITLLPLIYQSGFYAQDISLQVNGDGQLFIASETSPPAAVAFPGLQSNVVVSDGLWHHVAIIVDAATTKLTLIVDGKTVAWTAYTLTGGGFQPTGVDSQYRLANTAIGYVDQIVVSDRTVTTTDIKNRYVAGSLLRNNILSGDRIAEALVLAGYGTIANGALSTLDPVAGTQNYFIDGNAYVAGDSKNGCFYTQGTLSPVTGTTAMNVIQSIGDTETGAFYQNDDGTFAFHTLAYPYTNTRATTSQGTMGDNDTAALHYQAESLALINDDADVWPTVIVTPQNGTPQTYQSGNNKLYGPQTLDRSGTFHDSLEAALATAQYLGYVFQSPLMRVGNVELRNSTNNGSNIPFMLKAQIEDRVTFQRQFQGGYAINTDYLIETAAHEFTADPGAFRTTFVLDPYPIRNTTVDSLPALIFDDATYGRLDSNNALL